MQQNVLIRISRVDQTWGESGPKSVAVVTYWSLGNLLALVVLVYVIEIFKVIRKISNIKFLTASQTSRR